MTIRFTPEGYKRARKVLLPFASNDATRPSLYGISVSKTRAYVPVLFATNGHLLRAVPAAPYARIDGYAPDVQPFVIPRVRLTPKNDDPSFSQDRMMRDPVDFTNVIPKKHQRVVRADRAKLLAAVREAVDAEREAIAAAYAAWTERKRAFARGQKSDNDARRAAYQAEKTLFARNYERALADWQAAADVAKLNRRPPPPKPPKVRPAAPTLRNDTFNEPEPDTDAFVGIACSNDRVSLVTMRFVREETKGKIVTRSVEHATIALDASVASVPFGGSPVRETVLLNASYLVLVLASFEAAEIALGLSNPLAPVLVHPWDPPAGATDLAVVMPVRQ